MSKDVAYSNSATATGTGAADSAGHTKTASDTDTSGYTGQAPKIDIVKTTVDGTAEGDSLTINAGEAIKWKYVVKIGRESGRENVKGVEDTDRGNNEYQRT